MSSSKFQIDRNQNSNATKKSFASGLLQLFGKKKKEVAPQILKATKLEVCKHRKIYTCENCNEKICAECAHDSLKCQYTQNSDDETPKLNQKNIPFAIDYQKEKLKCLRSGRLFEDLQFSMEADDDDIEWLRPGEIVETPHFFVDGEGRFDVVQGRLGDCYFLAAVSTLTMYKDLFFKVVPRDQSFTENYAGIFHFNFWHFGKWVEVVIDDRLPTKNGKLIYMRSGDENEFWSALLEKAYAKLYGSYEALEGGFVGEALQDLTGGIVEYFQFNHYSKQQLMEILKNGYRKGSIPGCGILGIRGAAEAAKSKSLGLFGGHAYSITNVACFPNGLMLLRIRNPWGDKHEWKGAWSDKSKEWKDIKKNQKKVLQFLEKDDGEFWMNFDDFYSHFEVLDFCHLQPSSMNAVSHFEWDNFVFHGKWNESSAGGSRKFIDTFSTNPQFCASFIATQESAELDGKCILLVTLLQKNRRNQKLDSLPMNIELYNIGSSKSEKQTASFFKRNKPIPPQISLKKNPLIESVLIPREITAKYRLRPGRYIIVPSTDKPYQNCEFLIRLYCTGAMEASQVQ